MNTAERIAELEQQNEGLREALREAKEWDINGWTERGFALPTELRAKIHALLGDTPTAADAAHQAVLTTTDVDTLVDAAMRLQTVPHWIAQASSRFIGEIAQKLLAARPTATAADDRTPEITERDMLDMAAEAGLWPNTIHHWLIPLRRYTDAVLAHTPAAADAEDQEPTGWLFGMSYWDRNNPRITEEVKQHGRPLYDRPTAVDAGGQHSSSRIGSDNGLCNCGADRTDAVGGQSTQAFDFHAHLARQAAWSEKTFGPGMRTAGVCDHIRKELLEIEAEPWDLREWIDVVILGLDGAWRCGGTPAQIIDGIVAKQTKNESRTWPDWRTADPNKAIEHDRSADSHTANSAAHQEGGAA